MSAKFDFIKSRHDNFFLFTSIPGYMSEAWWSQAVGYENASAIAKKETKKIWMQTSTPRRYDRLYTELQKAPDLFWKALYGGKVIIYKNEVDPATKKARVWAEF